MSDGRTKGSNDLYMLYIQNKINQPKKNKTNYCINYELGSVEILRFDASCHSDHYLLNKQSILEPTILKY